MENNIIIDLSHLRHQEVSHNLIRLFTEFLLLYISRGLALRKKGLFRRRNIILIEEAQLATPEILVTRTLADGTTSEEVIGTLGGFGLSLMFISSHPHRLSRSIMAGCQTKIVFGVPGGFEANLLANILGVDSAEIMSHQAGECLVRSIGTGIVKIRAITLRMAPEKEFLKLETNMKEIPPQLLTKSRQSYKFIEKKPLGLYSSLVETIDEHFEKEEPKYTKVVQGWAASYGNLCEKTPYLVDTASHVLEAYCTERTKENIQKKDLALPFRSFGSI